MRKHLLTPFKLAALGLALVLIAGASGFYVGFATATVVATVIGKLRRFTFYVA